MLPHKKIGARQSCGSSDIPMTMYQVSGCLLKAAVLQLFYYYHKDKTIHESVGFVAAKVSDFWNRARIPTKQRCHVIAHIEKLFKTYCKPKENKGRMAETRRSNEMEFAASIEELFDIAHEDAMTIDNGGY